MLYLSTEVFRLLVYKPFKILAHAEAWPMEMTFVVES